MYRAHVCVCVLNRHYGNLVSISGLKKKERKERNTYHTKKPKYNVEYLGLREEILSKFYANDGFQETNDPVRPRATGHILILPEHLVPGFLSLTPVGGIHQHGTVLTRWSFF